jgi:hypothetical protein
MIEMMVKFNNHFGKMPLENMVRSIFDICIAGQISTDGKYYCIHVDHKTHEYYALTKDAEKQADYLGYPLDENEEAIFNGEKVRGMTYDENELYNMDRLTAHVDLWGNIAVDEEFDIDWYLENI